MGSGLILLVIVGAWLAVLVPMALKSHDSSASLKSADRFSDAMQVLSRRAPQAGDRRDVVMPRRAHQGPVLSAPRVQAPPPQAPAPRQAPSLAERRRRTLLVLVGLALVTLGLGLMGPPALLVAHGAVDLLAVAFVVHCRRQAVLKARRAARERTRGLRAERMASGRGRPGVTGVPDRMPPRPAPMVEAATVPAARYDDAVPATGSAARYDDAVPAVAAAAVAGTGGAWDPVPVPPPTYVGKPAAPPRRPRVLDLTKPGQWTAALEGDDAGLGIFDDDDLEEILERRRAVNDW